MKGIDGGSDEERGIVGRIGDVANSQRASSRRHERCAAVCW
jgi:hypothetical protein